MPTGENYRGWLPELSRESLPAGVRVLTDYLRDAGYFTSNCAALNWSKAGKTDYNFKVDKPFDGTD